MRVFVTGAAGHIGSAVVPELQQAGHEVVGLARNDANAEKLTGLGAEVRRGDLTDPAGLAAAAAESDGVIHLAFIHDFSDFANVNATDLTAVEAMVEALAGSGRPFVGTSGTMLLAQAGGGDAPGSEDVRVPTGEPPAPRVAQENLALAGAERGVRSAVVRLAPTVHSDLDAHGFVPSLIAIARERGFAGYVGDGANRWPAVHTRDAARLYRLALERAPAGSVLHGAAEEGVPFRQIAEAIGAGLGLPARSVDPAEAEDYFGFLARFVATDNPASSARTRELLGWELEHPDLLADLGEDHYFEQPQA